SLSSYSLCKKAILVIVIKLPIALLTAFTRFSCDGTWTYVYYNWPGLLFSTIENVVQTKEMVPLVAI
ncbi:MAG: hypothetical protein KAS98_00285, partial [Deltaproteobacteria bacterium]|nr:hypothetical protein [Deltaproteobacteria bacterium]